MELKDAKFESNRCLSCATARCKQACPVHNEIPLFLELVNQDKIDLAKKLILEKNPLMGITCEICPHFCENSCSLKKLDKQIRTRSIEKYAYENSNYKLERLQPINGKTAAVIGSGVSGIAFAINMARNGYSVTIFEKNDKIGGIIQTEIPEFRFSKEKLDSIFAPLYDFGVEIKTNVEINNELFEEIRQNYDYIYIATGANKPGTLDYEGKENIFYTSASLFLQEFSKEGIVKDAEGKKVIVIGGGNVAMDAARAAKRCNPLSCTIVYRRALEQMPANPEEIEEALKEGVDIQFLTSPLKVTIDALECCKMELTEEAQGGRRGVVPIAGSNYEIPCTYLIDAIGSWPHTTFLSADILQDRDLIKVNEYKETCIENIFAGGDVTRGPSTIIASISDAMIASNYIINKNRVD